MALPTSQNLDALDYAFWGEIFNEGAGKVIIDLDTLDYAFWGEPFNANEYIAAEGGSIFGTIFGEIIVR